MAWQAKAQWDISKGRPQTDFGRRDTEDFEEKWKLYGKE
jgi:hypothetical protein